ncbi:pyridoxamine 5'-phosphate oxidase [Syntrophotalea acetylenivorans]|uniref:Pyridoxamine 5'-phosphate oxidase n=1 Tax=Syntrophotalea acetylenivorans TaxID=1842532 RepID=A0A1L3GQ59_9BACT|nr:pyridoxamine 5'-phosphate oxidase family protein [Syntrophotalea acetylenivorans]APG28086.1 pyridoxamine 5'-phosphate oxidase [Syntrophotalea acetylenivorans]
MNLKDYFDNTEGTGILATADGQGKVDAAIYARPQVQDDGSISFIMLDRLSHHNLQTNPHAAFLFLEAGGRYQGVRLFLEKLKEDTDPELIAQYSRRCPVPEGDPVKEQKFLVTFRVNRMLKVLGGDSPEVSMG